jgi:Transglutaminase-like superfamily
VIKWRKFLRLARTEKGVFLQALVLLWLTVIGLRVLGYRRCQSMLARLVRRAQRAPGVPPEILLQRARGTARMVRTAAHNSVCRPNCLPRAIVLWWLLRGQGVACELRIGVANQASRLIAHAWVECVGVALDARDSSFRPFDRPVDLLATVSR